jgi:hypothetical protein
VYVYGVLTAGDGAAISATGVEGAAVRTVEHGPLAALVSDVDGGPLAAAREVRAHWRVLEEAAASVTVLPVRFGTVMESEETVRERLLQPHSERLTGLLRDLSGRVQLSVKGRYDEDGMLREIVASSPAVAALREKVRSLPGQAGYYQRIELGELVAGEVSRRRAADEAFALERLRPLAVDSRVEEAGTADAAFNLAFLVERDGVDAFSTEVAELGEAFADRIELRYLGPLPPYSFADTELTGGPAWA